MSSPRLRPRRPRNRSPRPERPSLRFRRDGTFKIVQLTSERLAKDAGRKLPALAFFHIPLPEWDEMWRTQTCRGEKHEPVCCPAVNSGFFAALVETGDVMGAFCGHDHVNDYEGEFHGIRLCYGRATGFGEYGRDGFPRGARVIHLREGERRFETWVRLEGGRVI